MATKKTVMFTTEQLISEVLVAEVVDSVRFLGSDMIEITYSDGTKNIMEKKGCLWYYVRKTGE